MIDFLTSDMRITNPKTYIFVVVAIAITIFLGNLATLLWLQDVWGGQSISKLTLLMSKVMVLVVLFRVSYDTRIWSPRLGRAWLCLAAGQLVMLMSSVFQAMAIADDVWYIWLAVTGGFYLLAGLLVLLGIVSLPGSQQSGGECLRTALDLISILGVLGLVLWAIAIEPLKSTSINVHPLIGVVGFAAFSGTLLLVFSLLLLLLKWRLDHKQVPYGILTIALVLMIVNHLGYGMQLLQGMGAGGWLIEMGQMGAALTLGLAGVTQWMEMHQKSAGKKLMPKSVPDNSSSRVGLSHYLSYSLLLGAYVLILADEILLIPLSLLWLSLGVGGVIGLVLVRQVIILRENNQLADKLVAVTGVVEQQAEQLETIQYNLLLEVETRAQIEERLLHDTLYDLLTGLPNRTLSMDRLQHALEYGKLNEHYRSALLYLDLDHFKSINEVLGHAIGDQLLEAVAERLRGQVRKGDMVARLGGDEFLIILEGIQSLEVVKTFAGRVLDAIKTPFEVGEHQLAITGSIGIVAGISHYDCPEDIVRDADIAMYQAKAEGKGRCQVFQLGLRDQILVRMEMENNLSYALERDELQLHYQPIHALESEEIIGFEALLRWNHPLQGLIQPLEFIAIAEETGLIIPIGRWVLENACRQLKIWQEKYPRAQMLTMNVNISSLQLAEPDFVEEVEGILEATGLDGACLRLEITESVCLQNPEALAAVFLGLDRLGIQLQIDDFGTGYSALSYLQNYPIRAIKIDRTFIDRMGEECHNGEIVRTIIGLAHGLGIGTVAEGIESQSQLVNLRGYGCKFGQGFHLSLPMNGAAAEGLLNSNTIGMALGC
jgi:diguanylate cyclase (GGDEF)-like protein